MKLSNTATPKYYGMFREAVLRGDIHVSREVSMEMNRIDNLIANKKFFYDPRPTEGFIRFCEDEMTLTDGGDLELLPTFKLWAEAILGWYYYEKIQVYEPRPDGHGGRMVTKTVKRRLIVKQYLIVARGASKSLYESLLQAYLLIMDGSTTQQITAAPTMKQAEEVMTPIKTAITRAKGELFQFMTMGSLQNTTGNRALRQKLYSSKKGIENAISGSTIEIRPMTINKLQGLRSKYNTVDEWLSGDTREDVIGALEQGASKHDDYLIVAVSSEGTVRNGVGDTIKMELASILRGEQDAPHISIWHYKLDDVKEVSDPAMWVKAQPNLGMTVSYQTYHRDVKRAEQNPAARNDILAKRFGIPMEGYTFYFTYEETIPHPGRKKFWQLPCAMGVDLSQGDDFCAFTFLFPLGRERYGIRCLSYITSRTLAMLPGALREKYDEFIAEGSLRVLEGTTLDMMEVYEDLEQFIEQEEFDVRAVGYDPYNAREFIERWIAENGPFGIEKVIQGARTESVPLGELKKLATDRLLIFCEAIMQYCMGNAVTMEDTNGNRKLVKLRMDEKIDNVSALLDGYVAYKLNKEAFE